MEQEQGIEYTIYTFDHASAGQKRNARWQKQQSFADMAQALKKAESLYKSGKFHKVEVKQKYFDTKKNRNVDTVLRIYESDGKKNGGALYVLIFAVLCGLAAFGVTYYLGQ